jgi:hypothetical protein
MPQQNPAVRHRGADGSQDFKPTGQKGLTFTKNKPGYGGMEKFFEIVIEASVVFAV